MLQMLKTSTITPPRTPLGVYLSGFKFLKPYCAVFGGFIVQTIVGGFLAVGNIIPYIASYITYSNNISLINENYNDCTPQIKSIYSRNVSLCNWILTASIIGYASFGPIGGKFYVYSQSMRWTIFVGGIILCIGILLSYYTLNYICAVIILYGFLFGAGTGIFWSSSIAAAMNWFPNKRAFVTGFVVVGMGFGQMVFDFIETSYINPTNIDSSACGFIYQQEIIFKVPTSFIVLFIFCLLCIILAILLFFENENVNITQDTFTFEQHNYSPSEAFGTFEFWLICLNCFLNMVILTFVYAEWKIYSQSYLKITNDDFLLHLGMTAALLNAFGRIFWGWILDKTQSYKITMGVVTFLITLFLCTLPLCNVSISLYKKCMAFIWINVLYVCVGATYAILPSALSHAFGLKHSAVILGFITWSDIPSGILQSFIVNITQNNWIVLSIIMAGISGLSFIVAMFYPSKKHPPSLEKQKTMSKTNLFSLNDTFQKITPPI